MRPGVDDEHAAVEGVHDGAFAPSFQRVVGDVVRACAGSSHAGGHVVDPERGPASVGVDGGDEHISAGVAGQQPR
jgi:hypothetical protein